MHTQATKLSHLSYNSIMKIGFLHEISWILSELNNILKSKNKSHIL